MYVFEFFFKLPNRSQPLFVLGIFWGIKTKVSVAGHKICAVYVFDFF